jgi:hypothetical protein
MKKSLKFLALAAAVLLTGCSPHEKLSSRTKEIFDMGALPMNNGYMLHGYRLVNGVNDHDHFVYVVEKDGKPVAGTATNYSVSQGKSTRNEAVTSDVPAPADLAATDSAPRAGAPADSCNTVSECEAKIDALNARLKPDPSHLRQLQDEYLQMQTASAAR